MPTRISDFLNTTFSTLSVNDAVNNGISYPASVIHTTTGTPGVGIGAGIQFQVETSNNNTELGMTVETVTTDVGSVTEDFDLVVKLMQNGNPAAERFRITSAGAASLTGALTVGSVTATGTITGTNFVTTGSSATTNGMYLPAANTLGLTSNSTERMRFDAVGNVAIGTTTTTNARLSIVGISGSNSLGEIYASDGTQWSRFASNLLSGSYNSIVAAADHGIIYSNGTTGTGAFTIAPWNSILGGMRLDANGNVSIGASSVTAGYKLDISGGIRIAGGGTILLQNTGDITAYRSGGTTGVIFLNSANTRYLFYNGTNYELPSAALAVGGAITATGDITAFSSDARLKTNVTPLTDALAKIQSLNGVNFTWTDQAKELGVGFKHKDDVGVMAQDVERVLPEAIRPAPFDTNTDGTSKSGENYLTVQYEKLTVLLIEAVKEQQQQIVELIARVEILEGKNHGK
jgi:hypothetical protein